MTNLSAWRPFVPHRFKSLVTYTENRLDIGMTMYRVLQAIQQTGEVGMELGGHSFALSYEMCLAKAELDRFTLTPPLEAHVGRKGSGVGEGGGIEEACSQHVRPAAHNQPARPPGIRFVFSVRACEVAL
eukprot:4010464-Pyramimonas_sp.AAC.1